MFTTLPRRVLKLSTTFVKDCTPEAGEGMVVPGNRLHYAWLYILWKFRFRTVRVEVDRKILRFKNGDVAQMVERALRMREAGGSMPPISIPFPIH